MNTINSIPGPEPGQYLIFVLASNNRVGFRLAFLKNSEYFKNINFISHTDQIPSGKNATNQPDLLVVCMDNIKQENTLIIPWIKKKSPKVKVLAFSEIYTYDTIKTAFLLGADGFIGNEACEQTIENMILRNITQGIPAVTTDAVTTIVQRMQGDRLHHEAASRLSVKQKTIAKLLVRGFSYVEIAEQLNQSIDLVRYHIKQIYVKLGIKTKIQLMPFVELE